MINVLLITTFFASVLAFLFISICASMYDVKKIRKLQAQKRRAPRARPVVSPYDIPTLFHFLVLCLAPPFIKTARFLGIRPAKSKHERKRKRIVFGLVHYYLVLIAVSLGCALYNLFVLNIIEPLLVIVAGFCGIYLLTTLLHEELTLIQKFYAIFLLPVALWYFALRLYDVLLKFLANVVETKLPIGVSLFVRIKDVLRIV